MGTVSVSKAEAPFILAIDIGSSSVRTILYDRLGRSVEGVAAGRPHAIRSGIKGASEMDADDLLQEVFECIDEALVQADSLAGQVVSVAVCTFVTNILGLDAAGQVVVPLTTYADTRSAGAVPQLKEIVDEAETYERTGCRFHTSYLPARLLWLSEYDPERFRRVARWLSIGEYLELKLFGHAAVSYSVASWSGLLDRYSLTWYEPLLESLPIKAEQLSLLADMSAPRRGLQGGFAERWPPLRHVSWFPAIGDGAAANIGTGCITPSQVALTLGTTTALRVVVNDRVPPVTEGLWCYRVDGRRSLLGGALTEGGSLYAWFRNTLRFDTYKDLESTLSEREPDCHGLTVLPYWAGERSPGWRGKARGTIHGLTMATTPLDLLQAGLESVAYGVVRVFELLSLAPETDVQVIASGGALQASPAWAQMIADVLKRPVHLSLIEEPSARGAALLALEALGELADVGEAPAYLGMTCEPDGGRHARYLAAMHRQRALYSRLL